MARSACHKLILLGFLLSEPLRSKSKKLRVAELRLVPWMQMAVSLHASRAGHYTEASLALRNLEVWLS